MLFYFWLIIYILFTISFVLPMAYWLKDELMLTMNFKTKTKVGISILAIILYIAVISITATCFNFEKTESSILEKAESNIIITEASRVYKNIDEDINSYYYVSTDSDRLNKIKVDKVTNGNKNCIITRKYEDGTKNIELVTEKVIKLSNVNK